MSTLPPTPNSAAQAHAALDAALRRLHRIVLLLLAACALTTLFLAPAAAKGADAAAVPPNYTLAAVGLGLGVVVARRLATSPVMQLRTRARLSIFSLVFAGLLGLLATMLGLQHGATQPALVFTLAGAVFILRPPALPPPPGGSNGA